MLLTEVENHAMERHNFIAELMIENCDKKGKKKKERIHPHTYLQPSAFNYSSYESDVQLKPFLDVI